MLNDIRFNYVRGIGIAHFYTNEELIWIKKRYEEMRDKRIKMNNKNESCEETIYRIQLNINCPENTYAYKSGVIKNIENISKRIKTPDNTRSILGLLF
jgi:hypothetical protein